MGVLRRLANPLTLIAAAVALVVGLGVGWLMFGGDRGTVLNADQQLRMAELYEKSGFDAGSVQLVTRDDEAEVWAGTTGGGESLCVVLDIGEESSQTCDFPEVMQNGGIGTSLVAGDSGMQVSTYLMNTPDGELVATLQRWDMEEETDSWLRQFDAEDRPRVEEIADEGYQRYTIEKVGAFRGGPVWVAMNAEGSEVCLIVDSSGQANCGPAESVQKNGLTFNLIDVDEDTGRQTAWKLELSYSGYRAYFTAIGESGYNLETSDPIDLEQNPE